MRKGGKLEGWKVEKLGDLCEKITDGTHVTPTYVSEGVPFLSVKNLTKGFIDFSDTRFISREEHEILTKRVRPEKEDILYTKVGTTGIAKVVDVDDEFSIFVSIALLKIKHELIFNRYLEHFLNSPIARAQAQKRTRGMANKNLVITDIKEIEIHYPTSLPEQQRIVSVLDEAFASIAQAKSNAERNLVNARELFESVLQDVYESGGQNWQNVTLGDVVKTTQGIQIPKSSQKNKPESNYRRYLYISDFDHDNNLKYVEDIYPSKIVTEKDLIVVNTGATAGKIYRGTDGILSNNLFKVSFDENILNGDFLYYFVTSEIFKRFQKKILRGTANPHMGHENFNSTPFRLPPLAEQRAIVGRLEALSAETGRLEEIYQQKVESLEELRRVLLGKAFEGEL